MTLTTIAQTSARDNGQWGDQPPEIRSWFQSVMQPENPYMSCCGEADAFEVELEGDEPDGDIAVRIIAKLQAKYGNPLDKYILFIGSGGRIFCLIPKVVA